MIQRIFLQLLFIATGLLIPLSLTAKSAPAWNTAEFGPVRIISDASDEDMRRFALHFCAYRETAEGMLAAPGRHLPRVTVLLFRTGGQMSDYLPKSQSRSSIFKVSIDDSLLLVVSLGDGLERAVATAAEFDTLFSLGLTRPGVPLWVAQGAGEVLCSVLVKNGQRTVGAVDRGLDTQYRNKGNLPWARFFAVDRGSSEYRAPSWDSIYLAQAWATMHYLLLRDQDGAVRFAQLMERLAREPATEAVPGVLGVPLADLEGRIATHLRTGSVFAYHYPFSAAPQLAALAIKHGAEAEAGACLSEILLVSERGKEADASLDQAAKLQPDSAFVLEALARRALRRKNLSQALQYYRTAIAAGSRNTAALLWSAQDYLRQCTTNGAEEAGSGGPPARLAVNNLRRLAEIDSGNAAVTHQLAFALFLAPDLSADELAPLATELADDAEGILTRFYRGLNYMRLADYTKADADLSVVMEARETPEIIRRAAQGTLIKVRVQSTQAEVLRLLRTGKHVEAHTLIAAVRSDNIGRLSPEPYAKLDAFVDDTKTWSELLQLEEEARWSELSVTAQQFLKSHPDSAYAAKVMELVRRAEGRTAGGPPLH
jgi:tetratricopeptide (TPR) repeat protein